jgi:nicotinamidase-related amidase
VPPAKKGTTVPLTKLDDRCALIVIDLQKGIVAAPALIHPPADIVNRAAELAPAFRHRHLPVVLVNVSGRPPGRTEAGPPKMSFPPDWTELVPELEQQPGDLRITKQCPGAFTGSSLDEILRERGVTQVFLAGIATSVGVESTARSAYDLGYNVVFVLDAITDRDPDVHRNSVEKIFPRLGETTTTDDLLNLLRG